MNPIKIVIRPERSQDHAAIRIVNEQAFGGPAEAALVDLLRERDKVTISLVATSNEEIVGHILFSPLSMDPPHPGIQAIGLAPMAVLPDYQNKGIGSQLVNAGVQACRTNGCAFVVVLGHPNYYPRFGFQRASEFGLENEYGADEAFMVLELQPGTLSQVSGLAKYAPEFIEADC